MSPDDYWSKLQATGWLASLPAERHAELRRDLGEALASDAELAFQCLATGFGDGECIADNGDYVNLLRIYSDASGGVFAPTAAADSVDIDNEHASVRFEFRGRLHETDLPFTDDFVPDEFHAFVNDVLRLSGVSERFHFLPTDDQSFLLAFVEPEAFSAAVRAQLIPDAATFAIGEDEE